MYSKTVLAIVSFSIFILAGCPPVEPCAECEGEGEGVMEGEGSDPTFDPELLFRWVLIAGTSPFPITRDELNITFDSDSLRAELYTPDTECTFADMRGTTSIDTSNIPNRINIYLTEARIQVENTGGGSAQCLFRTVTNDLATDERLMLLIYRVEGDRLFLGASSTLGITPASWEEAEIVSEYVRVTKTAGMTE